MGSGVICSDSAFLCDLTYLAKQARKAPGHVSQQLITLDRRTLKILVALILLLGKHGPETEIYSREAQISSTSCIVYPTCPYHRQVGGRQTDKQDPVDRQANRQQGTRDVLAKGLSR